MVMKFTNNATSTLASGINASVTSLTVATGQGALFPTLSGDYFYCTLANTAGTVEIIKVTARSTDTFTIVRAQDNTSAASWITGDKVELRLVAASLNDLPKLDEDNTFTGSNTIPLPVINNIKLGYTTTATAAGTTTLTSASNHYQRFTGVTTQTIVLPVTSTLTTGITYAIENTSTGNLTVNSSGGNLVVTVISGVTVQCMCIGTTLTTAADWDPEYNEFAAITGSGSVVLATSPTINNPTVTNYVESVVAIGNSGTTQTLVLTSGTVQTVTMTGNCTFTMPTATAGKSFILICTQDGTGSRTAVFTSVKFPNGTAPTLTTTATTGVDILTFVANGTSWFGTAAQNFS